MTNDEEVAIGDVRSEPVACYHCGRKPTFGYPNGNDGWGWFHVCQPEHPLVKRLSMDVYWFVSYERAVLNWNMFNRFAYIIREAEGDGHRMDLRRLLYCFREGGVVSRVDCDPNRNWGDGYVVFIGGEQIGSGSHPCEVIATWLKRLGGEDMAGWRMKFSS